MRVLAFAEKFIEIGTSGGRPALIIFGFPIYFYAIIIVTGMVCAILLSGYMFKKRGIDPYDVTEYALAAIPFGVLGARLYVYIFPWAGRTMDWSTFFDFRSGGLGIYGGIILGYIAAWVLCRFKKQDWWLVLDCIMGNVMLAQAIGRWGNFLNQEAYGNLVTSEAWQWFPYAVHIGNDWYQATFFYESFFNVIGFLICFFVLFRNKNYRKGWIAAFYGIYYGLVRLFIEGMRSDSLYLWIGKSQSNIKISQLVSVAAIILGVWRLTVVYRKQIHALYSKLFASERNEVFYSRFWLMLLCVALTCCAAFAFAKAIPFSAETALELVAAVVLTALDIYCVLGVFALFDRMKLYCPKCGARNENGSQACVGCGAAQNVKLNAFLLKVFPFKVYKDLSVDGIKEYVDPEEIDRKSRKAKKEEK